MPQPNESQSNALTRVGIAGFTAGLRSQQPFAAVARHSAAKAEKETNAVDSVLRANWIQRAATLGVLGELVVDKLPFIPSRLEPQSLVVRSLFGGISGALIAHEAGLSWTKGAAVAAATSFVGSFSGYVVRKQTGKLLGLPDPIVAFAEDAIAARLARIAAG